MPKCCTTAFCSCLGSFRHVSIPGLKTISDRDQPLVLKLIWLTVIVLCFYLCINQLSGRIEYYFRYPVTLSYELRPVDRMQFPIITLCEKFKYGGASPPSENLFNDIDTCRFSGSKLCNSSDYWFVKQTAEGSCLSLIIPYSYYYFGPSSGIRLTLKDSGPNPAHKWSLTINHQWDEAIYDSLDNSIPIYSKLVNTITYTEKLYLHENVSIRPCFPEDVVRHCRISCHDRIVLNGNNCSFPFMTTLDLPLCNFKPNSSNHKTILKNAAPCGCGKACESRTYELQVDTREETQFNSSVVHVFSNREEVEVLAEKRAFVLYALICEIGGTLGLFLGACILTFIEIIECVTAGICQKAKETRVRPLESKPPFFVYTINVSNRPAKFTHFSP